MLQSLDHCVKLKLIGRPLPPSFIQLLTKELYWPTFLG
jgi:hypothetical protein